MGKKISLGAAVVVILLAVLVTFQITYLTLDSKYEKKLSEVELSLQSYQKLAEVDSIFRSMYIGEIDEQKLSDYIIKGYMAGSGEKFGGYFTKEEFSELMSDVAGEMQGIGIHVIYNSDYGAIEVVNVMPDSPALAAGVMPGDLILYVGEGEEQQSVYDIGYYKAVNMLRGEAGTTAEFTVYRGEKYEEKVNFSVVRGYVTTQTVMYHQYEADPTIGIIKITNFDHETPTQFFEAVETLMNEGSTRFVMDIRYNPGGELQSIHSVLDYLLPEGPVIRMIDKAGNESSMSSDANELDVPMVVLINGSTASAGELFASALKDYNKAVLVGTTTFGKGSMQRMFQLPDGSGLSITYQMYYPPFSDNYDGVGVIPDLEVELDESLADKNIYKITDEEDNQLQAAIGILNS